ncbi:phytanoyl-CoA dioxygenase family protein [Actinomadura harenae]|uniref:Phytanoyl-CoA dioxygenase family protein n=1 Tax=Actinomadura harenae TaxID=2483351 RepID=A0A3M2LY20_9ACTN|nr:phytanoyl-CoA dioxygenase family protein [Actinomadura harenae]RMI42102.1 hypothetical protein EBO15_20855 [Actinomadura harenae]
MSHPHKAPPTPLADLLNADAVRFAESGYVVLPPLPLEHIETLRGEAAELLDSIVAAGGLDRLSRDPRVTCWRLADGQAYVLKIKHVTEQCRSLRSAADGPMAQVAAHLLGAAPLLIDEKVTYKQRVPAYQAGSITDLPVLDPSVHKHTDAAYYTRRGITGPVVTVALCLDEVAAASGPVRVWPGSHHRAPAFTDTAAHGPVVDDDQAPDEHAVPLTGNAGTVLAWDARLVHASAPNTTGDPRRLMIAAYARTSEAAPDERR